MPIQLDHQIHTLTSERGLFMDGRRSLTYPSRVINADVVISGFRLRYDNSDHRVAEIYVNAKWTANVNDDPQDPHVDYEVYAALDEQDVNDPYSGFVNVLVIAETE
jgi:hypothetical protein